jgi:hypothetical protein
MGKNRNAYGLLVGKPEEKRPLGIPRRRWVDKNEMDLGEIGWVGADWIDLQDREEWRALVNTVMNFWAPYNAGKFSSSYSTGSLSRKAELHRVIIIIIITKKNSMV